MILNISVIVLFGFICKFNWKLFLKGGRGTKYKHINGLFSMLCQGYSLICIIARLENGLISIYILLFYPTKMCIKSTSHLSLDIMKIWPK